MVNKKLKYCMLVGLMGTVILGAHVSAMVHVSQNNVWIVYAVIFVGITALCYLFGVKLLETLHLKKEEKETDDFSAQVIKLIQQANGYIEEASRRQYSQLDLEIVKDCYTQLDAYKRECNTGRVHTSIIQDLEHLCNQLEMVVPKGEIVERGSSRSTNSKQESDTAEPDYQSDFDTLNSFQNR